MEFAVALDLGSVDLARIDEALREVDPAALVDADGGSLRIAGVFDIPTLVSVLRDAGCDVSASDVQRLPSVCCGGCSG
ncbi:hypothetical protein [Lysobacter changpingensis]|jgi:hypothetical protein|uniref:hypothetical protein n=1 Tax=Lysobacter changpingensis TaxID=2792784 RepID=UPI001A8ED8F0|nr:hypothetical protein [Lysobacter changpingensis]